LSDHAYCISMALAGFGADEIDLTWERPIIDAYEASFTAPPVGFWTELLQMVGIKRKKHDDVRRWSVDENAIAAARNSHEKEKVSE